MTQSAHGNRRDLVYALKQQAARAGQAQQFSDWQPALVTAVATDGTLTAGGIPAIRRLDTYTMPAVGDWIAISQSGSGDWMAWGRLSTGGMAIGETADRIKPGSTGRSSVTAVSADPDLAIAVVPGTYNIDSVLFYDADSAADLRLGWSAPAGTTGTWWPGGSDSSNTTQSATARWGAVTDIGTTTLPVAGLGAGTIVTCRPTGTAIVTTAGTLALAWAQQVSSATATTVRVNSRLNLRRIA